MIVKRTRLPAIRKLSDQTIQEAFEGRKARVAAMRVIHNQAGGGLLIIQLENDEQRPKQTLQLELDALAWANLWGALRGSRKSI